MKITLILIFALFSWSLKAEPISYFEQFFDRVVDITHDPDFPQREIRSAKNDLYQVVMTGDDTAVGLILTFSLKPEGKFSFYLLPMQHRWKEGQRQFKLGRCQAYNGDWEYREGALYLGDLIKLEPIFRDGLNLLSATFLNLSRPVGTEDLEVLINNGEIDSMGGFGPHDDEFRCGLFTLPFWIPIPNSRPW
jgi:hypothetical protein